MSSKKPRQFVPLFSRARFEPDTIVVMVVLGVVAILLYLFGLRYLVIPPAAGLVALFAVNAIETIQVGHPEDKRTVGKRCLIVRRVEANRRGIVRVFSEDNHLGHETWSAEVTGTESIEEGRTAKVVGQKSIILLVEGEESHRPS